MTPNQLTTLRLGAGIGAAGALAVGDQTWSGIGAGLFVLSLILDRADGDLARLTGKTSPGGHAYDLAADSICNALIFVGLGVGLRDSDYGLWAIAMGLVAGGAVAAILGMVIKIEALEGARAAEIGGFMGFDPDDAILIVPIAIWFGALEGLLLAAVIGAPAFALLFLWLFKRKLKQRA